MSEIQANTSSFISESRENKNVTFEEIDTRIPKKRGRKKKSETPQLLNEDVMSLTRSDRRKKVDYFALLNNDDQPEETPRKRKRIIIKKSQDRESGKNSTEIQRHLKQESDVIEQETSQPIPHSSNSTETDAAASSANNNGVEEKPRRGRKSKEQKLAEALQRRQQEKIEYDNLEENVTCGRCNVTIAGRDWKKHKQNFHNDLAWKLGEPPIDLNDRALVTKILTKVYKARRPLNCENCGLKKKSVLGFLSHKMQCERTEEEIGDIKVTCELCGSNMLPVSLAVHMRLSHGPRVQGNFPLIVPKSKRKSAAKAEDLIQMVANDGDETDQNKLFLSTRPYVSKNLKFFTSLQAKQKLTKELEKFGHIKCKFESCGLLSKSVAEILKHMLHHNSSQKDDIFFGCRACLSIFHSQEAITEHVKDHLQVQDSNDFDLEESSGESDLEETSVKKYFKKIKEPRFLMRSKVSKSANVLYPMAYLWSSQFCKTYYNIPNLFPNYLPHPEDWQQISEDLIDKYSPEHSHSLDIFIKKSNKFTDPNAENYEWQKIELFESLLSDTGATIFCGGPITAISWLSTPHDENVEQILAVAITLDFNKKYYIHEENLDSVMIQIWNFGMLDNENLLEKEPQLDFCLCGDLGYITDMVWCPSGCYDLECESKIKWQRLGLLAVASSNSYVQIYSVPKPSQLQAKLIKPKPVQKLEIQTKTEQRLSKSFYIPTKLSWTKAQRHRYIAVGYSNGLVALFDLNTNSPFLKNNDILRPIQIFQPHLHCITALHLHHTSDGCRWLATGSLDRNFKLWDLTNTSMHMSISKKVPVTDGVWLSHWSSFIFGFDDDGTGSIPTQLYQARYFRSDSRSILHSGAPITAMCGSDWLNGIIQGNSSGELIAFFPHQLLVGLDNDRSFRDKKLLLSYARAVEKNVSATQRLECQRKSLKHAKETKRKKNVKEPEENSDSDSEHRVDNSHVESLSYEPLDYEGIDEKFGIVFCDTEMTWNDKETLQKISYQSSWLQPEQSNAYALVKVNKISINPNKQSYVYFASGFQNGLVRIASLRGLKKRTHNNVQ